MSTGSYLNNAVIIDHRRNRITPGSNYYYCHSTHKRYYKTSRKEEKKQVKTVKQDVRKKTVAKIKWYLRCFVYVDYIATTTPDLDRYLRRFAVPISNTIDSDWFLSTLNWHLVCLDIEVDK